jgi:CheY-like chemotaxis protein
VARLAGGVAHDFNNLLTAVIGYADLLVLQLDKEGQQRRHSEEIKRAGLRAATLTRQLLAFSRQQVMRPKDLNLNDVLVGMEPALRKVLGAGIGLSIVRGEGLGTVRVDPSQLEDVVVTLALRAREAMPEGGEVAIETANADLGEGDFRRHLFVRPGPYVMLAVTDAGPGMDAETQTRLFEPFSGDAGPGRGLGLSSVYGIVKQSEGYIWAESEPGSGTTFRVYLPRLDAVPSTEAPVPEERLRGTETVLVVEDEPVVLELVREVLADKGYTVLTAANGEEGVKVLSSDVRPIHLLLTDVVMPLMAGPDLADRAETLRPEIKVLFMSGYTEQTVMRHGVVGRRATVLQKPFTSDTVARKVREVLDAPRVP